MKAEGAKNLWKVMWNGSLYMLNFHSEIVFEHPYESPWYTWPLDLVPLMDAGDFIGEDKGKSYCNLWESFDLVGRSCSIFI